METDSAMANQIPDIHSASELRKIIEVLGVVSLEKLSEIAAIAKLALASLEVPETYLHPENIACALSSIVIKVGYVSDHFEICIEEAGCSCIDARKKKRSDAWVAYRKKYE